MRSSQILEDTHGMTIFSPLLFDYAVKVGSQCTLLYTNIGRHMWQHHKAATLLGVSCFAVSPAHSHVLSIQSIVTIKSDRRKSRQQMI